MLDICCSFSTFRESTVEECKRRHKHIKKANNFLRLVTSPTSKAVLVYLFKKGVASEDQIQLVLKVEKISEILSQLDKLGLIGRLDSRFGKKVTNTYELTKRGRVVAYYLAAWKNSPLNDLEKFVIVNKLPPNSKVLDVGCGSCKTLFSMSKYNLDIGVGIDLNKLALRLARVLLASYDSKELEHLMLLNADAHFLPIRDQCLEVVICSVTLPYLFNEKAIAEMSRVMCKGGFIFLRVHPAVFYISRLFEDPPMGFIRSTAVLINGLLLHITGKQLMLNLFGRKFCEVFQTQERTKKMLKKYNVTVCASDPYTIIGFSTR